MDDLVLSSISVTCIHGTTFGIVVSNKIGDYSYMSYEAFVKFREDIMSGKTPFDCGGYCEDQSKEKHYSVGHSIIAGGQSD